MCIRDRQEFGAQLGIGEVDVAIGGDDWVRERQLEFKYEYGQEVCLEKVLGLRRGMVSIVVINAEPVESADAWLGAMLAEKPLVTMASEMPYLSLEWFLAKASRLGFAESHGRFSVQKFKTPARIERGLVIYETWGKTEAKIKNASVDFGVEITQTGGAIRNYGLDIVEEIMRSEAGIWVNPTVKDHGGKYDLARMFLLNVYGALFAENKVLVCFNAKKDNVASLRGYLERNRLFADEPTMNEGVDFVEFSIQMDTNRPELPLAQVRYELAKLGATHIETIPLESSIPGLDAIDF